jgi:hypothetical protein
MLIYLLLYLIGLVLSLACLCLLIVGIRRRDFCGSIIAILVPLLFWSFIATLRYFDHRKVERYKTEHGGELPPWLW